MSCVQSNLRLCSGTSVETQTTAVKYALCQPIGREDSCLPMPLSTIPAVEQAGKSVIDEVHDLSDNR
jgi:hypothetical protein